MSGTQKTVWMISGNKGGVGKSLFCLALASALEARGASNEFKEDAKYAVLDGDGRTGDVHAIFKRKCPARWADFRELRPDTHNCMADGEYEDLIHRLLVANNHLIINTPDGADKILLKWFDKTLAHTEPNNYRFNLIYLMSDRPDGLESLNDLATRFQYLYPVYNNYFGNESVFSSFNREYKSKFHEVLEFPKLRAEEVRMIFDLKTYPAEAMRLKTLPIITQSRLFRWQNQVNTNISELLEGDEKSNVVVELND